MKKIISSLIVLSLVIVSLFGCVSVNVNTAPSGSSDGEMKKFIVGFDAEYPPFGYLAEDGSDYVGFDLDLAREFCKRNNMQFVAQPIDWDSKDLELNSGSIDCIWNGFTMNGRENDYEWTVPYVDNSIVLVVRNDSGITDKSGLKDKIVMVQAGSSGLAALESEENADLLKSFKKLEQTPDYNSAFMNLESGIVDAVAVDIGVARYQLANKKGLFVQLDENVSSEQYAVGFKVGNTTLRDLVQNTLFDMWKDGTVQKVAENYADYSLPDTLCLGNFVK